MRWRDDGAKESPSLIWITTNCRGPWGEFQENLSHRTAPVHNSQQQRRVFPERQNGKAINGPSFMFWRSFRVKVNSFDTWTFERFAFARAHVCVCVCVCIYIYIYIYICWCRVGIQGVANKGEISIIDSQTDDRRGYYFSIRSTDYITRLLFLMSLY